MTGFEPATTCSQSTCATSCATFRLKKNLSYVLSRQKNFIFSGRTLYLVKALCSSVFWEDCPISAKLFSQSRHLHYLLKSKEQLLLCGSVYRHQQVVHPETLLFSRWLPLSLRLRKVKFKKESKNKQFSMKCLTDLKSSVLSGSKKWEALKYHLTLDS